MMKKKMSLLLGGMLIALSANASITGHTSGVTVLADPTGYNVGHPGDENSNIIVFEEKYSLKLTNDLTTDTGTISAGSYIGSYFVHFNPPGASGSSGFQQISFSDQILGIIYRTSTLNSTDSLLGHSGVTTYPTETYAWRGLETSDSDGYSFLNATSAEFLNVTNNGIDQMRIITAAPAPVPLPAAVWMFGAGIIGLAGFARRSMKGASGGIASTA